jgi:hypothetical protein
MATKLMVLLGFVVAFSAGLFTGLNTRPPAAVNQSAANGPTTREGGPRRGDRDSVGFIARELYLTSEQRDQMR